MTVGADTVVGVAVLVVAGLAGSGRWRIGAGGWRGGAGGAPGAGGRGRGDRGWGGGGSGPGPLWSGGAGVGDHGPGSGARWATRRDLRGLAVRRPVPGRLVLGAHGRRLVAGDPAHSVLVVGPTQSGKTTAVAVPAILRWPGPVVAASVKADLARDTVGWRARLGGAWVFDPAGVAGPDVGRAGARPAAWTPVDAATTWAGARRVAGALVEAARAGDAPMTDGDFWYGSAAKLLAPLLHAAAVDGAGVEEVVRWLDEQDEVAPTAALVAAGATRALQAARACWGRDDRQRSGVYATAESVIEAYAEPPPDGDRAGGGGAPRFDPAELVAGPHTLYVCAPAHHQRRLRPLFAALVAEVLQAAMDRSERGGRPLDPPLLVVVDEAANVAPVADLDVIAATAASHGIQLVTVWQDLAQVTARYGASAGTVVNNHRAKLFLSGIADPGTLDHASTLAGEVQRLQRSTTVDPYGQRSTAEAPQRERLVPPDALRRLPPGWGVLVSGHHQPCRLRLLPWYRDRELRRRVHDA